MNMEKTGAFIAELRRRKNLTQKELAAKLNVTDKAVSKWERGAGYPEITTIPLLAKELGVSANEILLGRCGNAAPEEGAAPEREAADVNLSETVEYLSELRRQKALRRNNIAFLSMTAAFLVAAFVCCLCDYVADGCIGWSLYVLGSEAAAWLTAAPLLKFRRNRAAAAMGGLTVSTVPLLLLIEWLCPAKNWVFPFALPIVAVALASLWAAVLLFGRLKGKPLFYVAFVLFLFGTVDSVVIHNFVDSYFPIPETLGRDLPTVIVAASCGLAAVLLLCFAVSRRKKSGANAQDSLGSSGRSIK